MLIEQEIEYLIVAVKMTNTWAYEAVSEIEHGSLMTSGLQADTFDTELSPKHPKITI